MENYAIERDILYVDLRPFIDTSLPPRFYGEVIDFVGYIKEKKLKKYLSLEKAAEMAAEEYHNNKELTAFHTLDGEDFYETKVSLLNGLLPL